MSGFPYRPWPGSDSYDYLKDIDRTGLAWEWLRRNAGYRTHAPGRKRRTNLGLHIDPAPIACIARWGCLCVEDPELRATDVSMLWSSAVDPTVLRVVASPCSRHDAAGFDLRQWANRAVMIVGDTNCEHVLLRGSSDIRLDVISGTLRSGPVSLRFDLAGSNDVERPIRTLRRFLRTYRVGDASAPSRTSTVPSRRMIDALRVHDALKQGASIRDIGVMLFGRARVEAEWPAPHEALKSCCRRLIGHARHMASDGYRKLLR